MYWLDRSAFNRMSGLNRLLQEMDHAFGSNTETRSHSSSFPKVNVWKNNDALLITAEVPGINPSEIDVNAHADKLVISGEVRGRARAEGDAYQRSERPSGKFHRELTLPFRVSPESVSALYKNGVLRITLGRAEEDKPKKISVKAA